MTILELELEQQTLPWSSRIFTISALPKTIVSGEWLGGPQGTGRKCGKRWYMGPSGVSRALWAMVRDGRISQTSFLTVPCTGRSRLCLNPSSDRARRAPELTHIRPHPTKIYQQGLKKTPKSTVYKIWILILHTWWLPPSFTSNSKTKSSFTSKSLARIWPTKLWRWLNWWHWTSVWSLKSTPIFWGMWEASASPLS